jgi:hypothetical protein
MKVTIQHWPVLERRTTKEGKLGRAKKSYVRAKAPTQEREVDVEEFAGRTRVKVYFGLTEYMVFSVRTGRSIGRADWILRDDSHKVMRELMTEMSVTYRAFEKEIGWVLFGATVPAAAPEEDDELPSALAESPANDVAT